MTSSMHQDAATRWVARSPRRLRWLAGWLLAAAVATGAAGCAAPADAALPPAGDSASPGSISVTGAWSRATAGGASVGVVYFEVINAGPADTLLTIECPAAERVEMHATTRADGIMKMRPVPSVDVAAAGRLSFQPGGLHAMLIGLKQPLQEGGRLQLTLVFRRAGKLRFEAAIQGLGTVNGPPATAVPSAPAGFRLAVWPQGTESPVLRLLDIAGHPRELADYRGRVLVIFFGFVRCPDACPTALFKLAQVMKRLGPASDRVQVLLITLDTERDTPELLKSYVTAFDPRFVGLTGTTEQIDSVAKSYWVVHVNAPTSNDYCAIEEFAFSRNDPKVIEALEEATELDYA